jgi:gliding motility-associated-like protein
MIIKSFDYRRIYVLSLLLFLLSFKVLFAANTNYLFIENKGQWPSEVLFKADIPGGFLFVKKSGLSYLFYDSKALSDAHFSKKENNNFKKKSLKISEHSVHLYFKNVSNSVRSEPLKKQQQVFNYFYGNDKTKWVSGAAAYEEIWLKDVYPNIDFRLYSIGESLKYEYLVHPGGNPLNINFEYLGLHEIKLERGELKMKTSVNSFKEFQPFTFQILNGKTKREVKSKFKLAGRNVSFEINDYDGTKDLIIDPELVFSSYSGSASDNWSHSATFDHDGNLYAAGTVFGISFPATAGVFQPIATDISSSALGLTTDVVIMKYSSDGQKLLYSTFLGGIQSEVPHSLICNSKGNLVVLGTTSSFNFPTTKDAFQKEFKGGPALSGDPITSGISFARGTDLFITVISKTGDELIGSTFMGGKLNDGIHDYRAFLIQNYGDEFRGEVFVDQDDDIYVASITSSVDFPVVPANSKISSSYDGVIFQLNNNVSSLKWSTYIGGKNYDAAYGIRVNADKEVFVVGNTLSNDLNTTPNALQSKLAGNSDAFIAKYKNRILQGLTYLGTKDEDIGSLIDIDNESNVYIFGLTLGNYPINGTVYQNPGSGQFIHSLNSNLSQTRFSTVFGSGRGKGNVDLVPTAFLVNDCGNIYIAGWGGIINSNNGYNENSTTTGLPVTSNAYRKETTGSNYYFGIFEAKAKSLLYATFFGSEQPPNPADERGDHLDGGTCRFDKNGIIYHSACVCRSSADGFVEFPTDNGVQKNHNSTNCNMAAFKFDIDALKANFNILDKDKVNPEVICAGTKVAFDNKSKGGVTYQWSLDETVLSRLEKMDYTFEKAGEYEVKLEAFNTITCAKSDSTYRIIRVIPFETSVIANTIVCSGSEITLNANGGLNYVWSPAEFLDDAFVQNPTAKVEKTTSFKVEISNDKCSIAKEVNLTVEDNKSDFNVSNSKEICEGDVVTIGASGLADYFVWTMPDNEAIQNTNITVSPKTTTSYTVQAFYSDGCKPSKTVTLKIDKNFIPDFDYSIEHFCDKPMQLKFENLSDGTANYTWNMGNGDSLNGQLPRSFSYAHSGQYEVNLKAMNNIGCVLETTKLVSIPNDDGIIPNAFSPNGDGKNDTFVIGIPSSRLNIFNRWGKLIFEQDLYDNSWGKDVESGTYFYELKLQSGELCKGWVEVFN